VLHKIADRIEENLDRLAIAETWDNGKPIRETRLADIPLAIDHFRYFASCIRTQEGSIGELDGTTVAYHFHEPLGRVFLPRCILENSELRQGVLMNPWRLK
jgi:aldehyde dehydrogenase